MSFIFLSRRDQAGPRTVSFALRVPTAAPGALPRPRLCLRIGGQVCAALGWAKGDRVDFGWGEGGDAGRLLVLRRPTGRVTLVCSRPKTDSVTAESARLPDWLLPLGALPVPRPSAPVAWAHVAGQDAITIALPDWAVGADAGATVPTRIAEPPSLAPDHNPEPLRKLRAWLGDEPELRRLFALGRSNKAIAAALGRSAGAVAVKLNELGLRRRRKAPAVPPAPQSLPQAAPQPDHAVLASLGALGPAIDFLRRRGFKIATGRGGNWIIGGELMNERQILRQAEALRGRGAA